MSNRQLEDKQEELRDRKLAYALGISFEDLYETDYVINTDESKDGLIYSILIVFKDTSSKAVLQKIKDIDNNNTVYLRPNALD